MTDYVCVSKAIRGECQSLINHFEDNPEDVTLMVGQKDSNKAVSTEALMTVFHPQDVENLDPKMVNTRLQMKRTLWKTTTFTWNEIWVDYLDTFLFSAGCGWFSNQFMSEH